MFSTKKLFNSDKLIQIKYLHNNKIKAKYIVLQTAILDGIGDWVHLLEIAKYLRNLLKNNNYSNIKIIGILCGSSRSKIKDIIENKCPNSVFDKLFTSIPYKKEQINEIANFYKNNKNDIICNIDVSLSIGQYYPLSKDTITISMLEHAALANEDMFDISLDMGFGYFYDGDTKGKSEGIRVTPEFKKTLLLSDENYLNCRIKFYNKLFDNYVGFSNKLFGENRKDNSQQKLINDFIKNRRFIPADIRDSSTLILLVKTYFKLYGGKCDFYVSEKLLDDKTRKELINVLGNCEFISPKTKTTNDKSPNVIRFFYGFPLDDLTYKNLYIFNGRYGVGTGGDDTFCTGFSSGNIPLHWAAGIQNSFLYQNIIPLLTMMRLHTLEEYFTLISFDSVDDYDKGKNNNLPKQIAKLLEIRSPIHKEWKVFQKFVLEHYDIFTAFDKIIKTIIKNIDKKPKNETLKEIGAIKDSINKKRIKAIDNIAAQYNGQSNEQYKKIINIANSIKDYPLSKLNEKVSEGLMSDEDLKKIETVRIFNFFKDKLLKKTKLELSHRKI